MDLSGLILSPGFIDLHCHLRSPGLEHKETIKTGSAAAAAGGFTTICAMPNTNPVIDDTGSLKTLQEVISRDSRIRVLPIAAITKGQQGNALVDFQSLVSQGVIAFSDDGNPLQDDYLMSQALLYSKELSCPIINHSESTNFTNEGQMNAGPLSVSLGLKGRPSVAEEIMVARDISLTSHTGGHLHVAHISTEGSVRLIREAKKRGVHVTSEVTPHHISLTERAVCNDLTTGKISKVFLPNAYNTYAKVAPPLRTPKDVSALIDGVVDGTVDIFATDHAPHAYEDKNTTFESAAFGISALETTLSSLLSLVSQNKISLNTALRNLTQAPAKILNLPLGSLSPGAIADIVAFNPQEVWRVSSESLLSNGKNTPWLDKTMVGKVVLTIANGEIVYQKK
jgi:dihydroorotase